MACTCNKSVIEPFPGRNASLRVAKTGTTAMELQMTDDTVLAETPRQNFLDVAQQEMIAFERKEREFRRQAKQERAAALGLPIAAKETPH